ncbi:hypothetical protein NQ314_000938, partial [Rhamnusium bicolor]
QLKQQRDKLKQYQKRIELTLNSDKELAKKLLNKGQKERAKLLLRKKRYQEQLLAKTDAQLDNLDKLTHDIEFAQVELQVVDGLKRGNEALKKVNEALNIEDIESILDETREGVDKQNVKDAKEMVKTLEQKLKETAKEIEKAMKVNMKEMEKKMDETITSLRVEEKMRKDMEKLDEKLAEKTN